MIKISKYIYVIISNNIKVRCYYIFKIYKVKCVNFLCFRKGKNLNANMKKKVFEKGETESLD